MIESEVKTKEGSESIVAYNKDELQFPILQFKKLQRNHKYIKYATDFITLDTETSHINTTTGWIYQWAIKFRNYYYYGRTPQDLIDVLVLIAEHYHLNDEKKILIYIHNLSYDFTYLKNYLYEYDSMLNVLAIDTHSILSVDMLGFKVYCSYKLTNMSLNALSTNYSDKYIKAVGEIDYNVVRYQDTELTPEDWFYMFSDVASQYDGILGYIRTMGYQYPFECPITSTGFVRKECLARSRSNNNAWREEFRKGKLDLEKYNLLRQSFMGGSCIASYQAVGKTYRSDLLRHKDFTSSYPARIMLDYFPVGHGDWYGTVDSIEEFNDLLDEYCCIFEFYAEDIHIKDGVTAPYIPSSKCFICDNPSKLNGRLASADRIHMIINEIDYKWIRKQYDINGDMKVTNMLIFKRGSMPDWLKDVTMEYFTNKCSLKDKDPLLYAKSKALLNAIYGMSATALVRPSYTMNDDCEIVSKEINPEKELEKYYRGYNSFMPYQYAPYVTAWARDALYTMIEAVGYDNFLYCDTDSVFYIETEENKKRMNEYISYCKDRAIKGNAYVGEKYLGLPEDEPPLRAFRTLHSKCYAMEEYNKKSGEYELNVVIAGVHKSGIKWIDGKPIKKTSAEELGNIDNLSYGFSFDYCGRQVVYYNDDCIRSEVIQGHNIELSSSAVIVNAKTTLKPAHYSISPDDVLDEIVDLLQYFF